MFLLRQFFMGLPVELSDAAKVDGASELEIFWRIILPLAKPALAVVALFQFIGSWNDYFGPLIYLNDKALYTVSLGIANMRGTYGFMNYAWIMAATVMSVLPIIVLFFFAQRTFIEGIALDRAEGYRRSAMHIAPASCARLTHEERHGLTTGLLFISPWIVGFLVFRVVPFFMSLYFSFTFYPILESPEVDRVGELPQFAHRRAFHLGAL